MNAQVETGPTKRSEGLQRQQPFVARPFVPFIDGEWIGQAVCYGPFRDGQGPGIGGPSRAELHEDLIIMSKHWKLLRMYGARGATGTILQLIQQEKLPLKVMVGAWIAPETRSNQGAQEIIAANRSANVSEVRAAIRLARRYPDIVIGVSVGNETQVSWSDHKVKPEVLIRYIREVREQTAVPVTTADDYNFWNKQSSKPIADEVDFIVLHAYAMWNGQQLSNAIAWTEQTFNAVEKVHPARPIVLGETGWATQKHNQGQQAQLIKGTAGEPQQAEFYSQITSWAQEHGITTFVFEAFDEKWKGGSHPNEVEKHWGLFRSDRTPKQALKNED